MDSLFYDGFENGRMNPENNDNRPTYGEEEEIIFKCHTLTDDIQCERTTNVENEGWQNAMGFENPQAIYKWLSGRSLPSLDNFVILSRLLHTSMEDILVIDGDIVLLRGIYFKLLVQ